MPPFGVIIQHIGPSSVHPCPRADNHVLPQYILILGQTIMSCHNISLS